MFPPSAAASRIIGIILVLLATIAPARAQYSGNDPCQSMPKSVVAISQAANTKLISAAVAAKINYICSFHIVAGDAENVSLVEGTGSTCGSNTAAVIGGTTAAAGPNLGANGVLVMGDGSATIASGTHTSYDVCLFQSGSGRVAGSMTYVQR